MLCNAERQNGSHQKGGFSMSRARLVALCGGTEPQLPMDARLRVCVAGIWDGEEQEVKLGNNGWQQVRVHVQDMARFQVDNAKMRTFSLVRIGPPLVLQVDLVPLSAGHRLSLRKSQIASLFGGAAPALPMDAKLCISVSGTAQPQLGEIKIKIRGCGPWISLVLEDCPDAVHAFINAFSPKNRTYFLVSGGPPVPVLRVDLMPSGSLTRTNRSHARERVFEPEASGSGSGPVVRPGLAPGSSKQPACRVGPESAGGKPAAEGDLGAAAGLPPEGSGRRQETIEIEDSDPEPEPSQTAAGERERRQSGRQGEVRASAGEGDAGGAEAAGEAVEDAEERRLRRKRERREAKRREEAEREAEEESKRRQEAEEAAVRQQALEEKQRRKERRAAKKQRREEAERLAREQEERGRKEAEQAAQRKEQRQAKKAKKHRRGEAAEVEASGRGGEAGSEATVRSSPEAAAAPRPAAAPPATRGVGEAGSASVPGSWSKKRVSRWLQGIGEEDLAEHFLRHEVDGSALGGLHLLGYDGMASQLTLMCGPVPAGSRLKLWARLCGLFTG